MTVSKRLFDLTLAAALVLLLGPLMMLVALAVLMVDGSPVIFRSDRMKSPSERFTLLKFRTMTLDATDETVSAGYKSAQITRTGRFLRRSRLDELPQLFNILRGDMSFVGPRPPLPRYVALRPDLYQRVLLNRPGVTGLASLVYHRHEEMILAESRSAEDTHDLYLHRCVPAKARLDLIWARHQNLCYDIILILTTLRHFWRQLLPARTSPGRIEKTKN
ncbi:MAG: sugar transferase, partial [Pseudomonadota bacterium]